MRGDADASAALNGFGEEVQQDIEEVRAFARDVYPLMLASERLAAARVSVGRCAAEPIKVEGGFELEPYPAIRAWLERVAAQPGHIALTD